VEPEEPALPAVTPPAEDAAAEDAGASTAAEPADATDAPTGDAAPEPRPMANVTPKEGRALFIGSVDHLKDRYFRLGQGYPDYQANVQFFSNAVETFGLGEDLLNIRVKSLTQRTFEDATEERQLAIQLVNFAAVPLLIAGIGIARFLKRRSEANAYERKRQRA
jgi:ABC-type uncharacterized transport system involved in gliding motility auxiliary subunit